MNITSELYNRVRREAGYMTRNSDEADDLTQDTFLRAMTTSSPFQGLNGSSKASWLHVIAKNRHVENKRKDTRRGLTHAGSSQDLDLTYKPVTLSTIEATSIASDFVHNLLKKAKLSPAQREILVLRFWEGMSLRDIAAHLGVPVNTAKVQAWRAIHILKDAIAKRLTKFNHF